jgi:hypothetical protein
VALAAVVYSLALQAFYNGHSRDTCLQITASETTLHDVQDSTACAVRERAHQQWGACLPGDPGDLWSWCLQQPLDPLLDLLACCAACTVNAVQSKSDSAADERLLHADRLAAALRLDMAAWFKPTAFEQSRRQFPRRLDVLLQGLLHVATDNLVIIVDAPLLTLVLIDLPLQSDRRAMNKRAHYLRRRSRFAVHIGQQEAYRFGDVLLCDHPPVLDAEFVGFDINRPRHHDLTSVGAASCGSAVNEQAPRRSQGQTGHGSARGQAGMARPHDRRPSCRAYVAARLTAGGLIRP